MDYNSIIFIVKFALGPVFKLLLF